MILSRCEIHRGCTIEVFFGERAGGRIPWPDPDLKPDAERDFPGLVPNQLKHCPKDQNAKAREAISELTAQVAELREDNKKLLDQLVATGFRNDELAQALQADQAVPHIGCLCACHSPIANLIDQLGVRLSPPRSHARAVGGHGRTAQQRLEFLG
jgi:hypothetical protein